MSRAKVLLASVLILLTIGPRALLAQSTAIIRGQVIQPDTITPAMGVVVVALDSAGSEVARSLSGDRGTYELTVQAPARYSLRALRIGYRPTLVATFDVAPGETKTLRILLAGIAVQLNEVRVESGQGSCKIAADVGRFVGDLWEQARTVLMASTLSAGDRAFDASVETFRQFTPTGSRAIAAETLSVMQGKTTSPFVSRPAELLAAAGYVTISGSLISYHSPDANALLSPTFAATHCFNVKLGGDAHPDWVGIEFRPSARRSGIADVEGVLWLDRASAELRRLEFKYVNLPRNAANGDAGGEVNFVRLLTGDWIISRWAIRKPETEQVSGMGRITTFRPIGRSVVGGLTLSVKQDGHELYRDRGATVTFILKARDTTNHVRGAMVGIDGTAIGAQADTSGGITITGLTEGRHKAHILTSVMAWIGATPEVREFDAVYEKPQVVQVEMPASWAITTSACSARGIGDVLFGTVVDKAGRLVVGARVAVEWTLTLEGNRRQRRQQVTARAGGPSLIERVAFSDEAGRWRLCAPRAPGAVVTVESETQVLLETPLSAVSKRAYEPIELRVP
jgi:hypothetical protein